MALSFDPSALLAQGGVMSGLDDLGAAVANAMNSRAARRYQSEREATQRKQALEDQQSSRTFQTTERAAGERAAADRQTSSQQHADRQQKTQADQRWNAELGDTEAKTWRDISAPLPTSRTVNKYDDNTGRWVQQEIPLAPEERQAELNRRDALVGEHTQRFNHPGLMNQWQQYRKQLESPQAPAGAPTAAAPARKPAFDPAAAVTALTADPTYKDIARDYGVADDPVPDQLASFRELTSTGNSPLIDWLGAFQSDKTPAGQTRARSGAGRQERAALSATLAQRVASQFDDGPAKDQWLQNFTGKYASEAQGRGAAAGPLAERNNLGAQAAKTAGFKVVGAHKSDPRYAALAPAVQADVDLLIQDGTDLDTALAAVAQ